MVATTEEPAPRPGGEWLVLNPNTHPAITALIDRQARLALGPGARLRIRSVDWGTPSIETHIDAAVAAVALLDALAQERGVQGVLVAAFGDPGLLAARELMDVPVAGMGESALMLARQLGDFAILTIQPRSLGLVRDLVRANACEDRCLAVEAVPISVLEAADPAAVRAQLLAAGARLASERRLRAIVLGGAPLGGHAAELSERLSIHCIDPVAAGVSRLAAMVASGAGGARGAAYVGAPRKPFEGSSVFIDRLNQALWP